MKSSKLSVAIIVLILILIPFGQISGDKSATAKLKPIGLQDSLAWLSIRNEVLSVRGQWLAYRISPNKGESKVIFRQTQGKKEYKFEMGQAPRRGGSKELAFSYDGRWGAYISYPTEAETKKLRKQRKRPANGLGLVNLSTGKKTIFKRIKGFSFSGENPQWLAMHKAAAEGSSKGKKKWSGTDLILRQLNTGKQFNFGNVSQYVFNKRGDKLAMVIDAEGKSGNGLQLHDLASGRLMVLDGGEYNYKKLAWTERGDALAVLRGEEDKGYKDKLYTVVGFKNFSKASPQKIVFTPQENKSFPEGMTISPNRAPQWSENLSALLFGIHRVEKKEGVKGKDKDKAKGKKIPGKDKKDKVDKEDLPGLVIWHWLDKRMQSMQQVQERRDKNFSFLAIYRIKEKKFFRLADDELRIVRAAPKEKYAIGLDDAPYRLSANLDGRRYRDIFTVNLINGKRTLAIKKCRWYFGASPDGTHFLHFQDGHYLTYDMVANKSYNITTQVPTSFVDEESDVNVIKPPVRARSYGWVKGGKSLLLYDGWDVWRVPVHGGKGVNLTIRGRKEKIRFQRRLVLDRKEKGIDLSDPVYLSVYGEWNKRSGIARLDKGKAGAKTVLWDDAYFSALLKAEKANIFVYNRETHREFPDIHVAAGTLKKGVKISEVNPQQKKFLWSSGVKLINYTSDKGKKLHAALFLPANYKQGKRYPTIVYIYEKMSQRLNRYFIPSARGFNKSVYSSNGYAVLMPDIVYQINDPGMSAVWCVLPAIKAAVADGVVDSGRVGIHGHSWGGYQTAFLITQTDLFKAAIAGAPLTNMISMYSSIYWNSGSANQPIFESSQGRFTGGYWQNIEAYTRNSPVYFANRVKTPLLLLHNDKDGAVDWNQGIEYFNTLRRLKKPVVMLQYKGENHGLRKSPNQIDYAVRVREFFDHYLKSKPAPKWLKEGIPHLKHKKHIEERAKTWQKKKAAKPKKEQTSKKKKGEEKKGKNK